MQSRQASLVEAGVNILIGYLVATGGQILIFPLFGIHVSLATNMQVGAAFTVLSLVRSYLLRRLFNHIKWGNK